MSDSNGAVNNLRYRRQIAFPKIQQSGQQKIADAKVAVVGVGALGSMIAERLTRAGVGALRLIDRDWVEEDNLPRQTLFTHADAIERRPKAIAAAAKLVEINPGLRIETEVVEFSFTNARQLVDRCDLILDGTDNFETRYLINDVSLETNIAWVHGGVLGSSGQVMAIVPHQTCCLRCILPEPPPPDALETCNSAGILGPSVAIVAAWQALLAIRLLVEPKESMPSQWTTIETWNPSTRNFQADPIKLRPLCPACGNGRRDFLDGTLARESKVLCGRNAVQLSSPRATGVNLKKIADQFVDGNVTVNPFFARLAFAEHEITIFADGRMIVSGTEDPSVARKLVDRWIGG